jgi:hypothetical protein
MVAGVKRVVAVLGIAAGLALGACGGQTSPPTSTVAEGTRVDAARYLGDAAAAAAAARAFVGELATLGDPATPAALRALAPRLADPIAAATLAGQRLAAERLDDRRLEEQRAKGAQAYAAVVAEMEALRVAAAAGDPVAARAAGRRLDAALAQLRAVAAPLA